MWGIPAALLIRIGVALGAFLIVGGLALWVVDEIGDRRETEVRAEFAERDRQAELKLAADEREARKREQSLNDRIAQSKQDQANAEAALVAARARIAGLLLNRPDGPATGPAAATAPANDQGRCWATGAQLYRNHGQFLERESDRSDRLRTALIQCYAQYDAARAAVNSER